MTNHLPTIGIIGAGFSGTALACAIKRNNNAMNILLFDKTATFGVGEAYRTPYPFHLLNVRAQDMSAYESEPAHFVNWLKANPSTLTYLEDKQNIAKQFVPRMLYRDYLQSLLSENKIQCIADEIIDIKKNSQHVDIVSQDGQTITVDQVVFALGNNPAMAFPFSVRDIATLNNPWDYQAPKKIATTASVLIVGTGLSMIDTVLTLHHQGHQGKIYAVSRHGLLPLPHNDNGTLPDINTEALPAQIRVLTNFLRESIDKQHAQDWRCYMNALRPHTQTMWQQFSLRDKKCFLRHALSYWNIHRHRVHEKIYALLQTLIAKQQLKIIAGRVENVTADHATIKLRHQQQAATIKVDWLVNCLGPKLSFNAHSPRCTSSLYAAGEVTFDSLQLGFNTNTIGAIYNRDHIASTQFFSLGPPTKGVNWECTAVPDIRKQSDTLARYLTS